MKDNSFAHQGHATAETIAKLIMTVKPREAIIPIHTDMRDGFDKLPIGEFGDRIIKLQDGAIWIPKI